jgi:hypothetical protein
MTKPTHRVERIQTQRGKLAIASLRKRKRRRKKKKKKKKKKIAESLIFSNLVKDEYAHGFSVALSRSIVQVEQPDLANFLSHIERERVLWIGPKTDFRKEPICHSNFFRELGLVTNRFFFEFDCHQALVALGMLLTHAFFRDVRTLIFNELALKELVSVSQCCRLFLQETKALIDRIVMCGVTGLYRIGNADFALLNDASNPAKAVRVVSSGASTGRVSLRSARWSLGTYQRCGGNLLLVSFVEMVSESSSSGFTSSRNYSVISERLELLVSFEFSLKRLDDLTFSKKKVIPSLEKLDDIESFARNERTI